MKQIKIRYLPSSVGELIAGVCDGHLCLLDYRYRKMRERVDRRICHSLNAEYVEGDDPVIDLARNQLDEYLAGRRQQFDLPLLMAGSDFQKEIWRALLEIPYGTTLSYLQLARKLGREAAIHAVAAANGANAISIVVPCHRIIGSSGELVGYAGGLTVKRKLLQIEQAADQLSFDLD